MRLTVTLKRVYAEQRQQAGDLANILKVHSLALDVLKGLVS